MCHGHFYRLLITWMCETVYTWPKNYADLQIKFGNENDNPYKWFEIRIRALKSLKVWNQHSFM